MGSHLLDRNAVDRNLGPDLSPDLKLVVDKRINLLFIVDSLAFGGAEKHVITLLNNLDTTRFRLSLAYLKNEKIRLLEQLDQSRVEGKIFCCDVARKVDMTAARMLAHYIDEDATDIVVCTNTYSFLYGTLARFLAGRKPRLIDVFHSIGQGGKKFIMQMAVYRPIFMRCDMLVYVCLNQKQFWRRRLLRARHDTVIHNGIELAHFVDAYAPAEKLALRQQYGFTGQDFVIGVCAALRPEKAHGDLLQAVARLRQAGRVVKVLFIGDGVERPRIEAHIKALGLGQQVKITGFIADVRPLIATCDAMALVSHNETFSISALEAMALGKAMIMTETGGAAEQITHGESGYLYPVADIDALTAVIGQMMDLEKCHAMGLHARSVVEQKFTLAHMIHHFERLFVKVAQVSASHVV
jgi:glycosyltransferase involved in cell wall biosynthesis